ncbi:MAG: GAF domain-containing protein, partial [Anaerolineales bacterium]|nr:GAF domain-containing protein [Anaerolineales bacterium]
PSPTWSATTWCSGPSPRSGRRCSPRGPWAGAARSGQAVVVNDVRANPDWLPNKLLPETQGEMVVPLIVGDRVVGVLDVQAASINRFTDLDVQIQTTLAAQVSIALENARSFEQAQTAVAEMNALTRRLTREGWDEYFDKEAQETLRFLFDGTSVHEAQDTAVVSSLQETPDELLERPIEVRGVKIGKMALVPEEEDPELEEVFNSVMQQLSAHIENLRLTEQVQTSLAQTEALYTGSERIVLSSTEADVLESLIYSTQLRHLDRANIFLFDEPVEDNVARDVTAVAVWEHEGVPHTVDVGTKFTVQQVPFMSMINSEASMVVEDIRQDPRIDDSTRQILEGFGMISFVLFPMVVGSQWLGMVSGQSAQPLYMNEVQRRQASSLVSQASVVLQTTILFRQEQARARREQMLRAIAAKVRSSTDVDSIMRTAVTEIGRTLGRRAFIKLSDEQLIAAAEENGVAL